MPAKAAPSVTTCMLGAAWRRLCNKRLHVPKCTFADARWRMLKAGSWHSITSLSMSCKPPSCSKSLSSSCSAPSMSTLSSTWSAGENERRSQAGTSTTGTRNFSCPPAGLTTPVAPCTWGIPPPVTADNLEAELSSIQPLFALAAPPAAAGTKVKRVAGKGRRGDVARSSLAMTRAELLSNGLACKRSSVALSFWAKHSRTAWRMAKVVVLFGQP
mmetsp:Transcript_67840/g.151516  ORF Transcript_67840/g.151516 Transcript_67840/m.151516 type:complete len:215 (-) Transcript_67840:310-954(-)